MSIPHTLVCSVGRASGALGGSQVARLGMSVREWIDWASRRAEQVARPIAHWLDDPDGIDFDVKHGAVSFVMLKARCRGSSPNNELMNSSAH